MKDIPALLEIAKEAALQAGKAILEIYISGDFSISTKGDNSPLTLADKAAHLIICQQLEKTGLPILSEEGRNIPYDERKSWTLFWLVDPLDGTKEFINRNGEFTVNIALISDQTPVAAVIYVPCTHTLYYGSKVTGAYRVKNDAKELLPVASTIRTIDSLNQKEQVIVVASKSHNNEATTNFIQQFSKVQLSSIGSSLKLMLLAEGAADIYPRLGPTMEWDIAAGHGILRVLNKGVFHTDMQTELLYNKEDLLNPSFIAL